MLTKEIDALKIAIVENADPERIILFGEKKHPGSEKTREVNLCVVVFNKDCKASEKKLYMSVESEIAFNLLVYSKAEFDSLKADETSYVSAIVKKGVVIYEKA